MALAGCRSAATQAPTAVRLVDEYDAGALHAASSSSPRPSPPRIEWRFDGSAPAAPAAVRSGAEAAPAAAPATRGWQAGPGVRALSIHSGRLTGVSTDD